MTRLREMAARSHSAPPLGPGDWGAGAGRRAGDVTALPTAAVGVFADAQTPPPLPPSLSRRRAERKRQSADRGPVCFSIRSSLVPGSHAAASAVAEATESAISGSSRRPALAARAPFALGLGLTRRRRRREATTASAPSSVSLGGLRSSLRLLLCPPSLPSSHFPSSGVSRPRLVLLQEQRSTPRRRR